MGWYGIFLVQKLKLAFSLRGISQYSLFSDFELFDRFFSKYDKIKEDIDYVQEIAEDEKNFSAKTTAKMFNVIDELGSIPESSEAVLLLYLLHKFEFEINHYSEDEADLAKLKKKGWKVIQQG